MLKLYPGRLKGWHVLAIHYSAGTAQKSAAPQLYVQENHSQENTEQAIIPGKAGVNALASEDVPENLDAFFRHRSKLFGLMFGHQRAGKLIEIAVHDRIHLV